MAEFRFRPTTDISRHLRHVRFGSIASVWLLTDFRSTPITDIVTVHRHVSNVPIEEVNPLYFVAAATDWPPRPQQQVEFGTASLPNLIIRAILPRDRLNLCQVTVTHRGGLGVLEVSMTKHRTITGFVTVALLAAAATAATMRSPSTDRAFAGAASLKDATADVNKLPIEDFDDQSFVFSTKR